MKIVSWITIIMFIIYAIACAVCVCIMLLDGHMGLAVVAAIATFVWIYNAKTSYSSNIKKARNIHDSV